MSVDLLTYSLRIILSTLPARNYRPVTDFPDLDWPLPSDLSYRKRDDTTASLDSHNSQVGSFYYQVQAVRILDYILTTLNRQSSKESLLVELRDVDTQLWRFLSEAINHCAQSVVFSCGPIATAIRSGCHIHLLSESQCHFHAVSRSVFDIGEAVQCVPRLTLSLKGLLSFTSLCSVAHPIPMGKC